MSRMPAIVITLHWSAVFSLLAVLSIFPGEADPIGMVVYGTADMPVAGAGAKFIVIGFALMFALCASLFFWALATTIWSDGDSQFENADVVEKAFAIASLAMTILLTYGLAKSRGGLVPVTATTYAALVASFVALRVERPSTVESREKALLVAAKASAMEASHSVLLARLAPSRIESRKERR